MQVFHFFEWVPAYESIHALSFRGEAMSAARSQALPHFNSAPGLNGNECEPRIIVQSSFIVPAAFAVRSPSFGKI
jgi:hypothetical protein